MHKCLTSNSRVADTWFSLGLIGMVSLVQRTRVTAHGVQSPVKGIGLESCLCGRTACACALSTESNLICEPCGQVQRKDSELLTKRQGVC